ncbi:hypothetical protein B6U83_00405 [Thermoplasmatales archaeon ex4484_36]|nr:MAG: hypothetical protein B6U83_00405 [Thermoplasmatales archaeon ex4484_36]
MMEETDSLVQIMTTVDSLKKAEVLARRLVEERYAACSQVLGPIKSTYWWEGRVERAEEWLIIFKTLNSLVEKATLEIERRHPYKTPEIILSGPHEASEGYLKWIKQVLGSE